EIHAPGIACAFGEDIELLAANVVAPDGGVHLHAIDLRMREHAVQSVELAVRSPLKGVQRLVRVLAAEASEKNLLLAGPTIVILDEEKVRRCAQEDAAVTNLQAGCQVPTNGQVLALRPDRDFGPAPVCIFLDNLDAIARLLPFRRALGIFEALKHP